MASRKKPYQEDEFSEEELAAIERAAAAGSGDDDAFTDEELAAIEQAASEDDGVLRLPFFGSTAEAAGEATSPAAPVVGAGETFVLRGAGAVPAGGLASDLLGTLALQGAKAAGVGEPGARLTPKAQADLYKMGMSEAEVRRPEDVIPGPLDTYRDLRDTRRLRTAAGSEQNPWAGRAGALVGTGASLLAPLPSVRIAPASLRAIPSATAAERVARIASGAATGGAYGAVNGLTDGPADLTHGEVAEAAGQTLDGALGGAAVGGLAAGGAELLRPAAGSLRDFAVRQGRRVIGGDSDIAAATRQALSDEAVLQALDTRAIRPFSSTPSTYRRLDESAEALGGEYGQLLQRLSDLGIEGPRAVQLAGEFMRRANEMRWSMAAGNTAPAAMAREAEHIGRMGSGEERLPLLTAESLKRDFQRMGRHERINNSPNEETYQELGSRLRQAIEDEVSMAGVSAGRGSEEAALASRFGPLKEALANTIAARNVGEKGASKALQKSPVGLKDMLLGASAGDPGTAALTALVSSGVRNRLPSTAASGAYALSEGLRTGRVSPELAKLITLASDPNITDTTQALIEALRRRKDQP